MAEATEISWCDSTLNFWVGCTEVGPACDHCYARQWAKRAGQEQLWMGERRKTKTWGDARKWHKNALAFYAEHGRRRRVFSNSLADFFDNEIPVDWRNDAWRAIAEASTLEWYLVTKRIPNVLKMLPGAWWTPQSFGHIVIIATVVTQEEWDRDGPRLKALKDHYPWLRVGLSIEPMLTSIDLGDGIEWLDWVICGGESGGYARAMDPNWALALLRACKRAGVPFHFKQVGSNHTGWPGTIAGTGAYPQEWPKILRVREWPKEAA